MRSLDRSAIALFVISVATSLAAKEGVSRPPVAEDKYIVIVSPAPIRATVMAGSEIIGRAVKGDVYELVKVMPSDYSIFLFEGDERFIPKSAARVAPFVKPTLSEDVKRRAYLRFAEAEDRSFSEADARIAPTDVRRNIALQRLLDDRFKLEIVHQLRIPPAMYDDLIGEGISKHWPSKSR